MDVAITGASGFIGSHMARYHLEQGNRVTVFATNAPRDPWRRTIWDQCHRKYTIDLTAIDPNFNGMDRVYHFAADMGGVGFFTANDYWPYIKNSRMDFRVLNQIGFWEVPRSFVAASACAYPTENQRVEGYAPALNETLLEQGQPDQMYGRAKLMLTRLAERHPGDVRVGILHTIYGEGQEYAGPRVKFPRAAAQKARQARTTGKVTMWGNGQQLRSYLHVDDAIRMIEAVMGDPENCGPINVGYQGAATCLEIQQLCNDLAGVPDAEITFDETQPSGVLGRDCDGSKMRTLYGLTPKINYPEGFRRIVEWLDLNGID